MHCGKKWKWNDGLGSVLMGNPGSRHSCRFDMCHQHKYCRPDTPFLSMAFLDCSGVFHQHNAPCYSVNIVRECFEKHEEFKALPCPPNFPDRHLIMHLYDGAGKTNLIRAIYRI